MNAFVMVMEDLCEEEKDLDSLEPIGGASAETLYKCRKGTRPCTEDKTSHAG